MTLPKTLTALIGSAFAIAAVPMIANASPDYDEKSVEIAISGYDLAKPEDAEIVYKKIQKAAKRACRNSMSRQSLRERAEELDCREKAITQAVTQLNEPVLTLVMNGRNPTS